MAAIKMDDVILFLQFFLSLSNVLAIMAKLLILTVVFGFQGFFNSNVVGKSLQKRLAVKKMGRR